MNPADKIKELVMFYKDACVKPFSERFEARKELHAAIDALGFLAKC